MSVPATDPAVRQRPILFSSPMVRAILAGRKTQTRRVLKFQPNISPDWEVRTHGEHVAAYAPEGRADTGSYGGIANLRRCPYGRVGDRLWVRETWAANATLNRRKPSELRGETIYYRATYPNDSHFVWRPSIHMPRWASRLTLEITAVRVERLQAISEDDAMAEGCEVRQRMLGQGEEMPRHVFRQLWDTINGKRSPWESNPWVWALTFRRLQPIGDD